MKQFVCKIERYDGLVLKTVIVNAENKKCAINAIDYHYAEYDCYFLLEANEVIDWNPEDNNNK